MAADLLGLGIFVFAAIFLMESVDRTNFTVISLAQRYGAKDVWIGASAGFVLSVLVSVGVGALLLAVLGHELLLIRIAAGGLVLAYGIWILVRSLRSPRPTEGPEPVLARPRTHVVLSALGLIFLLEMGDNTQFLIIAFVTTSAGVPPDPAALAVILGAAALGLIAMAALGSHVGAYLQRRVPRILLERISGSALMVIGAATIIVALLA